MLLGLTYQLMRFITDLVLVRTRSDAQLGAEVLALRHQLRLLERKVGKPAWQPADRILLAGLSRLLPKSGLPSLLPKPETLLRWHRDLVCRKWAAFRKRPRRQRRLRGPEQRALTLQLAEENPRWGYRRIRGGWSSSAFGFHTCRWPGSCAASASCRLPAAARPPGGSSSASRPPRCWPATSSRSRRLGSSVSTSSSSSRSPAARSTSPASPPTRPASGWPSKLGTWPRGFRKAPSRPACCSGTATPSSPAASIRSSVRKASKS